MRSPHATPNRAIHAVAMGGLVLLVVMLIPVVVFWLALAPAPRVTPRPVQAAPPAAEVVEAPPPSALFDVERMEKILLQPILKGRTP